MNAVLILKCNNMTSLDQKQTFVRQARGLCAANSADLLFLTLFGSTLYGTEVPGKSDLDIRGIFMPSMNSLALDSAPESLRFSTGSGEERNTAGDVDIDLWSLQHWLLKLLPCGDIGALDVLFAPSHQACALFMDARMNDVFQNPLRLLEIGGAYAQYSLGQAKKYGIKGSRIGALKAVHQWLLNHCSTVTPNSRLRDILEDLASECVDGVFCTVKGVQGEQALQLCGKLYIGSLRTTEFIRRVALNMRRYGARAVEAEQNNGIDFKALSHALRALDQMEELLISGKITFPLKSRAELLAVKQGKFSWAELEPWIISRLQEIDLLRTAVEFSGHFDRSFAEQQILACYRLGTRSRQRPAGKSLRSIASAQRFNFGSLDRCLLPGG